MKVAICDDDSASRDEYAALLCEYARERDIAVEVRTHALPFDLLDALESGDIADVYLLDIFMPGMDGVRLARSIRRVSPDARLVFLTSSHEHAVEAFELNASHYLEKPVSHKAFFSAIDRAAGAGAASCELWCKTSEGYENVRRADVCFIEGANRYRRVIMRNGRELLVSESLHSLAERLSDSAAFISPHRSYIVNLKHVVKVTSGNIIMNGGAAIPISRGESSAVKERFMNYLFPVTEAK